MSKHICYSSLYSRIDVATALRDAFFMCSAVTEKPTKCLVQSSDNLANLSFQKRSSRFLNNLETYPEHRLSFPIEIAYISRSLGLLGQLGRYGFWASLGAPQAEAQVTQILPRLVGICNLKQISFEIASRATNFLMLEIGGPCNSLRLHAPDFPDLLKHR